MTNLFNRGTFDLVFAIGHRLCVSRTSKATNKRNREHPLATAMFEPIKCGHVEMPSRGTSQLTSLYRRVISRLMSWHGWVVSRHIRVISRLISRHRRVISRLISRHSWVISRLRSRHRRVISRLISRHISWLISRLRHNDWYVVLDEL